jgi:uracil-DNA glycosylase family 4
VRNVTDRTSDPFDLDPPCERSVPGYGDANAHFHVVGDHPGRHGGAASGVPFTGTPAADRLQRALRDGGLLEETGTPPVVDRTYLSYLHMCVVEEGRDPTPAEYADMERFFDAELRGIAAHVLLPVGERAVRHVLREYTARDPSLADDLDAVHATEIRGGGWLVVPVADPADWRDGDGRRLADALVDLRRTDYRRESDLGRFLAGSDPYFVR